MSITFTVDCHLQIKKAYLMFGVQNINGSGLSRAQEDGISNKISKQVYQWFHG